jgi:hypothetical protein
MKTMYFSTSLVKTIWQKNKVAILVIPLIFHSPFIVSKNNRKAQNRIPVSHWGNLAIVIDPFQDPTIAFF